MVFRRLSWFLLLLGVQWHLVLSIHAVEPCAPLPGILYWWTGEGVAQDQVRGWTGDAAGKSVFGEGRVGGGFRFDGTTGLSLPDHSAFPLTQFTVEAWLRRSSDQIVSSNSTTGILLGGAKDSWNFGLLSNGVLTFGRTDHSRVETAPLILDTAWHHVAVTRSGTVVRFYVDGVGAGSFEYAPAFLDVSAFGLGVLPPGNRSAFLGSLDEVTVFGRVLEPGEISAIVTAGQFAKCFGDIAVSVSGIPTTSAGGSPLFVVWTLQNRASTEARNVRIRTALPNGFGMVQPENPRGVCSISNGILECGVGNLEALGEVQIRAVLTTPSQGQVLRLRSEALLDSLDVTLENNVVESSLELNTACLDVPSDLAGWWNFESHLGDMTGRNRSESIGAPERIDAGVVGRSLRLNGTSSLLIPAPNGVSGTNLTVALWVYPLALDAAVSLVASSEIGIGDDEWIFRLGVRGSGAPGGSITNGNLCFAVGGIGGLPDDYKGWMDAGMAVPLNQWSHVALVIDSALHAIVGYVNGVEGRRVLMGTGAVREIQAPLHWGARSPIYHVQVGPKDRFQGALDEAMIFRRALSADEIRAVHGFSSLGVCADDIEAQPDSALGEIVPIGQAFPLMLRVVNRGNKLASRVRVTQGIPGNLEVLSVTNSQGLTTLTEGKWISELGLLTPGGSATVTMSVRATNGVAGEWKGEVTRGEGDLNLQNNAWSKSLRAEPVTVQLIGNDPSGVPNEGAEILDFQVSISPASFERVELDYSTESGTAVEEVDFLWTAGTLVLPPGTTKAVIPVRLVNDAIHEGVEELRLRLSAVRGGVASNTVASAFILDDDPIPVVTIGDAADGEGNGASGRLVFTVRLSHPSVETVTVHFATTNEVAKAPIDFEAVSGVLQFAPGEREREIVVNLNPDTVPEPNETFAVLLSSPQGATLGRSRGVGTLLNDDGLAGQVGSFEWALASDGESVGAGESIRGHLIAMDKLGQPIPTFTGLTALSAYAGSGAPARVVLTEVQVTASANQLELQNVTPEAVDLTGWSLTFYDAGKWPSPAASLSIPAGTLLKPFALMTVNDGSTALGTVLPRFALGTRLAWQPVVGDPPSPRKLGVVLQDEFGDVRDTFFADGADPTEITVPTRLSAWGWSGRPLPRSVERVRSYQRNGNANFQEAVRWDVAAQGSMGKTNASLVLPFIDVAPLPVSPATVSDFLQGGFEGEFQIHGFASQVRFYADDGNGTVGRSSSVRMQGLDDVSIQLLATPLVGPAERIEYVAIVTNPGPSSVTNLSVSIRMDSFVKSGSALGLTNTHGPTPVAAGQTPNFTVTAVVESLAPGNAARIAFNALSSGSVASPLVGDSVARAEVSAAPSDLNSANNVASAITGVSTLCVQPTETLVAWWPATDLGRDWVGTNHALLKGGGRVSEGRVGTGYHVEGAEQGLEVADFSGLNLEVGKDFGIDLWLRTDPSEQRRQIVVLSKRDAKTGAGYSLGIVDGLAVFSINSGTAGGVDLQVTADQANLTELRNGRWHHVAVCANRSTGNTLRILVDGKECRVHPEALSRIPIQSGSPLRIGGLASDRVATAFTGDLDEIAVWSEDPSRWIPAIVAAGGHGRCQGRIGAQLAYPFLTFDPGPTLALPYGVRGQPYRFEVALTNLGPYAAYGGRIRATSDVPVEVIRLVDDLGNPGQVLDARTFEVAFGPVLPFQTRTLIALLRTTNAVLKIGFRPVSLEPNLSFGAASPAVVTFRADSDGDGMDDTFEKARGLNPNDASDATRDADGDGLTALEEFRLGTNPANPNSGFPLLMRKQDDGQLQFSWVESPNRVYQFVRRGMAADADWEVLAQFRGNESKIRQFEDPNPPAAGAIYAVRVVP